jgi:hypothetical protein
VAVRALNNTYVVFTSDNGWRHGGHRITLGEEKLCDYVWNAPRRSRNLIVRTRASCALYVTSSMTSATPTAPKAATPLPRGLLSEGEIIALSIIARWSRFASERDFYSYALRAICEVRSPSCPGALNSTASCASMPPE